VKAGSIGKPVPGHEIRLVTERADEEGVGEIAFRTPDPVKFKRYIGRNESDEEYYEDDWYLTGDLKRESTTMATSGTFPAQTILLSHPDTGSHQSK